MNNSLNSKIRSIVPHLSLDIPATGVVAGATGGELAQLLSKAMQAQGVAILAMTYPDVDERNHRSLDSLAHQLTAHGFSEISSLIHAQTPFLLFDNLSHCMKVYHEIQLDSAAISAQLYYAGDHGMTAEKAIDAILHPQGKSELAHAA